jgi:uncharacterized protein YdiU (UPF0061 family)
MLQFDNTYTKLPEDFFQRNLPSSCVDSKLIRFNEALGKQLGFDKSGYADQELADIFSGKTILPGSDPIAMNYAGHQFGHFSSQLGDGRAILLGEVIDTQGQRFDIQLKGSGITKYSRRGDGLAALGPVLREYIVSETMHAYGIPTTRSLAAVTSGGIVFRDRPQPGAILTRVASSHIRVGTFEYFSARQNHEALKKLADYSIHRHYPEIENSDSPYIEFFRAVGKRQALLISQWMSIGFIHGVMNTDNMTISGQTIDYGPCAFMDHFSFGKVYSSIDHQGRYAYGNQPQILFWNLYSLANCLRLLIHSDPQESEKIIQGLMEDLQKYFYETFAITMCKKIGIENGSTEDLELIQQWFGYIEEKQIDFTNGFRKLAKDLMANQHSFESTEAFETFYDSWKKRLSKENKTLEQISAQMDSVNPLYIPRNHLIEKAIQLAEANDYSLFHKLVDVLANPFTEQSGTEELKKPPEDHEVVQQTFCGT